MRRGGNRGAEGPAVRRGGGRRHDGHVGNVGDVGDVGDVGIVDVGIVDVGDVGGHAHTDCHHRRRTCHDRRRGAHGSGNDDAATRPGRSGHEAALRTNRAGAGDHPDRGRLDRKHQPRRGLDEADTGRGPVPADEDHCTAAVFVVRMHPDVLGPRWRHPLTVCPHPVALPHPVASHPDCIGERRRRRCLHQHRGRRPAHGYRRGLRQRGFFVHADDGRGRRDFLSHRGRLNHFTRGRLDHAPTHQQHQEKQGNTHRPTLPHTDRS